MDVAHPHGRINYSGSGYTRPLSMRRIRISFRSLLFVLLGWAQSLCVLTKHYTSWEGGARTWDSVPAAWQSISYLISWQNAPKTADLPPTESCTGVWGIASFDLKTDEKSYIQITVYDICMQDSYVQLVKTSTTTRSRPCAGGRPPPPPSSLPHPSRAQPQVAPQTACHSEWCCPDVT